MNTLEFFSLKQGMTLTDKYDDWVKILITGDKVIEGPAQYGVNNTLVDCVRKYKHLNPQPGKLSIGIFDWSQHCTWGDRYRIPLTASNYDLLDNDVKEILNEYPEPTNTELDVIVSNLNIIGWDASIGLDGNFTEVWRV